MADFEYPKAVNTADRLIKKFGRKAVLRRTSGDRPIRCVMLDYTTREQQANQLIQFADQRVFVSAKGLTVPPDNEEDVLVVGATREFIAPYATWRLVAPPGKLDPAGTVVFWELQVRK